MAFIFYSAQEHLSLLRIRLKSTEHPKQSEMKLHVAILTVSDRCFGNEAEDLSGSALRNIIDSCQLFSGEVSVCQDNFNGRQAFVGLLLTRDKRFLGYF